MITNLNGLCLRFFCGSQHHESASPSVLWWYVSFTCTKPADLVFSALTTSFTASGGSLPLRSVFSRCSQGDWFSGMS